MNSLADFFSDAWAFMLFGAVFSAVTTVFELVFRRKSSILSVILTSLVCLLGSVVLVYYIIGVVPSRSLRWYGAMGYLVGWAVVRCAVFIPIDFMRKRRKRLAKGRQKLYT